MSIFMVVKWSHSSSWTSLYRTRSVVYGSQHAEMLQLPQRPTIVGMLTV